jgi:3-isopropylmalate/(R)-2-methylmalate dehydratase small subunit
VDLETCQIAGNGGFLAEFAIEPFRRAALLEGLDEIGMTLKHEEEIADYERRRNGGKAMPVGA